MSEEDIRAAATMPTQPPENAELAVTQEDRDAAADALEALNVHAWEKSVGHIRAGNADKSYSVQAFARHRRASLSSPVLPGVREDAEAMVADYQTSETHHPDHILVPREAFEAMRAALQQGQSHAG